MSKQNYTHISIVLDRSGSMSSIVNQVTAGYKEFIEAQKNVEGEATLTLARFDNAYDVIHDMVDIKTVSSDLNLQPRGWTALLDAMGQTMERVRSQINDLSEENKPSKCIFVFITDGGENSSQTYTRDRVFQMIEDLRNDTNISWDVIFMGANQDAIAEGGNLGVRAAASLTYNANTSTGTLDAFHSLTKGMTSYRTSKSAYSFSDEDRKIQNIVDKIDDEKTKNPRAYMPSGDLHI